ncbi:MAG: hypothetical protein H7A46_09430 [Verrucomicrobiales bacterium]|nr:hypothetical protein [Verrucomicrobiales bacterium]
MNPRISRRSFVKSSALAATVAPVALAPQARAELPDPPMPEGALPKPVDTLPTGRIRDEEFTRLMLGGNLIGGYAHARDLTYVSHLMKRYNTDARIVETLEVAETHGINCINSWVVDGISHLQHHWKRGGKMKWIAQARLNGRDNLDQFKQAVDLGAAGVHVTGDVADTLVQRGEIDMIGRIVEFIRSQGRIAGIGAHGLDTIVACEKAKLNPDFYIKTIHSHDYHTAPGPDETGDLGRYDNSWCSDPEEVREVMFMVKQPWIGFKVLAAGAIPPWRGFRHAFESGADFILVGMFDWQIPDDVATVKQVLGNAKRLRPWRA